MKVVSGLLCAVLPDNDMFKVFVEGGRGGFVRYREGSGDEKAWWRCVQMSPQPGGLIYCISKSDFGAQLVTLEFEPIMELVQSGQNPTRALFWAGPSN
jgi:hypothetical protein